MDEINEEIMFFSKGPSYEANFIFVKKHHLPHLYRLASRVLCIPGQSLPWQEYFPRAGF